MAILYDSDKARQLISDTLCCGIDGMVTGFRTATAGDETLYAVFSNDRAYQRTATLPNDYFDQKGMIWRRATNVPADAEYIGRYREPDPKRLRD